jgi:hypothetical protein
MDKKKDPTKPENKGLSRRRFVKGAATVAAVAATVPLKDLVGGPGSTAEASTIDYEPNKRTNDSFIYRRNTAILNKINIGEVPDNGDLTRFTDFSANYSKVLRHDGLGVPNRQSYQSFIDALASETFTGLNNVIIGTPGGGPNSKMNGPATAFAFDSVRAVSGQRANSNRTGRALLGVSCARRAVHGVWLRSDHSCSGRGFEFPLVYSKRRS